MDENKILKSNFKEDLKNKVIVNAKGEQIGKVLCKNQFLT